ncbi:hypothetical protein EG328_008583 [Venturia inaequalis]|uniref:Uncharacterized protein n=1 Tax=Venturia inaequalis TaxID=5025 RepID=A0A8H3VRS6_VENIN|nr:hypothetical protein EG328_008583 [Venturia inaequalis]KAE9991803.1 hypothetical protein EG327_010904 [Venturia inaequalis]
MKSLYPFLVSLLAATSFAGDLHRLCCCTGFNACNQYVCDPYSTGWLIRNKPTYVRSNKYWGPKTGAPVPGTMAKNYRWAKNYQSGEEEDQKDQDHMESTMGEDREKNR